MNEHAMKRFDIKYKLALCCTAMLFFSACTTQFLATDVVSTMATDKTVSDHVISVLSNKDCSSVRQELGLTYCKEDDPRLQKQPKTYCYRELGKVTCYEQADVNSVRPAIEDRPEPTVKRR